MDDGYVIQGLNERWKFMGATLIEWGNGFVVFLIAGIPFSGQLGVGVPFMMVAGVSTAYGMAALRSAFPDQERGLANKACSLAGFPPIGVPAPSALQPFWSGTPLRGLPEGCRFKKLGLEEVLPSFQTLLQPDEISEEDKKKAILIMREQKVEEESCTLELSKDKIEVAEVRETVAEEVVKVAPKVEKVKIGPKPRFKLTKD